MPISLPFTVLAPRYLFRSIPPQPQPDLKVPPEIRERPPWQPDNEVSGCNLCGLHFTVVTRRHHCRHCAKVFLKFLLTLY